MTITPAKALKLKNSLVKQISTLQMKMELYNSYTVGSETPYNTKNVLTELENKTQELVNLKTALTKANGPIQDKIYKISELKSMVGRLKNISTNAGKSSSRSYGGVSEPIEYKATITTLELEDLVKTKELQIESLQEEIDTFNHTAKIEL